jgi:hypothetical protein
MAKPVAAEAQSDISGFHGDARAAVYQNSAVGKAGKHRAGKPRSQPSPPPADVTRAGSSQNDGPYPADPMTAYK